MLKKEEMITLLKNAMYAYRMRILSDEVCVTKKTRWFSKIFIK